MQFTASKAVGQECLFELSQAKLQFFSVKPYSFFFNFFLFRYSSCTKMAERTKFCFDWLFFSISNYWFKFIILLSLQYSDSSSFWHIHAVIHQWNLQVTVVMGHIKLLQSYLMERVWYKGIVQLALLWFHSFPVFLIYIVFSIQCFH